MHHLQPHPDDRSGERGLALILAIMFTMIVVGITVTGALVLKAHQEKTKLGFIANGQAVQFAKSGLVEALGWCRKQTSQPVAAFAPVLDTSVFPPILETIDPAIGLVREFQITERIWGRYEVWKDWSADPNPARLAWRNQMRCQDVSALRGNLSPGSIWRIRSVGYVYRRVNPAVPYNTAPNHVLGQEMAEVEARRLALLPPGQAALCARSGNTVSVLTRGRLVGDAVSGTTGCFYLNNPSVPGPTVSGTGASISPAAAASSTYDDSFEAVFGVSQTELTAMADYVVTAAADFPSPVPVDTLVMSTVGMNFTAAKPLKGTGVVVIVGNTTIGVGSYSAFSGLLYVQGNLTVREPSEIQGAVVVTGTVTVQGNADYATITYDDDILAHLRQELGTYRLSSAVARPLARDR